jgi:hypothetical protein
MYLSIAMATLGRTDSAEEAPSEIALQDALEPVVQRFQQLLQGFCSKPVTPQMAFEFEQQVQTELRELARIGVEWAYNHIETSQVDVLPPHVEFDAGPYTRLNRKTPHDVATSFGKIRLWRVGYRPTQKTGDPTIFPLAQQLGIVAGATPALAERAASYQAEAGATQRRTLQRLKQAHGVDWGVKKLRQVIGCIADAMTAERHEVQVEKLLQLLEQAWSSKGKHKPVLSVRWHLVWRARPSRHDIRSGECRHRRGAGSSWPAIGHRIFGLYARVEARDDEWSVDAVAGRSVAAGAAATAASMLCNGCRRQRDDVLRHGAAADASSTHGGAGRMGPSGRLLSRERTALDDGRSVVWQQPDGQGMGAADAEVAEAAEWRPTGTQLGCGVA